MKKRLLSIFLSICVIASVLPLTAFAATGYGIYIGGEEITSSKLRGAEWDYNPGTHTLTLNNYDIATLGYRLDTSDSSAERYAIIYVKGEQDLTIRLIGMDNNLGDSPFASQARTKQKKSFSGIYAPEASITFSGDGKLNVVTHEVGLYVKNLTLTDTAKIYTECYGTAAFVRNSMVMGENTSFDAYMNCGYDGMAALSVQNELTVNKNAVLNCTTAMTGKKKKSYTPEENTSFCSKFCYALLAFKKTAVNGGIIRAVFNKTKGAFSSDYSDMHSAFGIYTIRMEIDDGGIVESYINKPQLNNNEIAIIIRDFPLNSNGEPYGLHFKGSGVIRAACPDVYEEDDGAGSVYYTKSFSCNEITCDDGVLLEKNKSKPDSFKDYSDYNEYYARKYEAIYLDTYSIRDEIFNRCAYFEDDPSRITYNSILTLDKKVIAGKDLNLIVKRGEHTVDPLLSDGKSIPEIIVEDNSKLTLKNEKWNNTYRFDKPIKLNGGTIVFDTNGFIENLNIEGVGTVIFERGTVSGTVADTVNVIINGGSIDIPDNGRVKNRNGVSVSKIAYTVDADDKYTKTYYMQMRTDINYRCYDYITGDKKVYFWLPQSDLPYGVYVLDEDGNDKWLTLRYGSTVFSEGLPFEPITKEYFFVKDGEQAAMTVMNSTPSDIQKSDIESKWYSSSDGKNYSDIGGTDNAVSVSIPSVKQSDNGLKYKADVKYRFKNEDGEETLYNYTYNATVFVDNPEMISPDKYASGAIARFEVKNNTPPEGITLHYQWYYSDDHSYGIMVDGATEAVYEFEVTDDIQGREIYCKVWATADNGQSSKVTYLHSVTVDITESVPKITKHPLDAYGEEPRKQTAGEIPIIIATQAIFEVEADAAGDRNFTYQWQISTDNGRSFVDIPNANDDRYSVTINADTNGNQYRCKVSNQHGFAISNAGTVTLARPPKLLENPSDLTVKSGEKVIFDLPMEQGKPAGTEVIWQVMDDGDKDYRDVTDEDGIGSVYSKTVKNGDENITKWFVRFETSPVSKDMSGRKYRCILKTAPNETGYVGAYHSSEATLTVIKNCNDEGHSFGEFTEVKAPTCTDTGTNQRTCAVCGYIDYGVIKVKGHNFGEWTSNGNDKHTRICKNNSEHTETEVCSGGTANCTQKAKCDICKAEYGILNMQNHTGTEEWITTPTTHTKQWTCCSIQSVDEEMHTWEKGVCSECGHICKHLGGSATCINRAICEICGEKYGEINPDNHSELKHVDAKAATKDDEGNIEYWYCSDCGKYFSDENGKEEIAQADTVIEKIKETKPVDSGDSGNVLVWTVLVCAVAASIIVIHRKKTLY